MPRKIVPAILALNLKEFKNQTDKINGLFKNVQLDIMDGKFVPAKSYNNIKKINSFNFSWEYELHLMVENPIKEIKKWSALKNVNKIIFHIESTGDPKKTIALIKKNGYKAGIALNPKTPIKKIIPFLQEADEILFMTVNPGKQGAKFISKIKNKITQLLKENSISKKIIIAADGGINEANIKEIESWGVNLFNIGSAIIKSNNPKQAYKKILRG